MKNALLVLAEDFEEVEAVTVIDLLRRAGVNLTTTALDQEVVTGSHKIKLYADTHLSQVIDKDYDAIILPGGPGTKHLRDSSQVIDLIKKQHRQKKLVAAICAAPTVLNKAGILVGKKVTSFPAEEKVFENSIYIENKVVKDGHILTSRGAGTAVDFALAIIEELFDQKTADNLARKIVYQQ